MDHSHASIIKRRKLDVQGGDGVFGAPSQEHKEIPVVVDQKHQDGLEDPGNNENVANNGAAMDDNESHLLLLSDEVLLMILEQVEPEDISNVFWTCRKLQSLCYEPKLTRHLKGERNEEISVMISHFLGHHTQSVTIYSSTHGSCKGNRTCMAPSQLAQLCPKLDRLNTTLRCDSVPNLTHVSLVRLRFAQDIFRLQYLPCSLRVLDLTGTMIDDVTEETHYFKDVCQSLPKLEELNLSDCNWVLPHHLMALSKLPRLHRLVVRGCRHIGCCLAYTTLSFRFGFKAIRIMDATNANFGEAEVQAMSFLPKLEEFYFGEYDMFPQEIRDPCLRALTNHKHLRILDMSGHNITDRAFSLLVQLPSLERVDAYFTNITQEGVTAFKQQLKRACDVNFSTPFIPASALVPPIVVNAPENNNGDLFNIREEGGRAVIHADVFHPEMLPNDNHEVGNRIVHVHYVPPIEEDSESDAEEAI